MFFQLVGDRDLVYRMPLGTTRSKRTPLSRCWSAFVRKDRRVEGQSSVDDRLISALERSVANLLRAAQTGDLGLLRRAAARISIGLRNASTSASGLATSATFKDCS